MTQTVETYVHVVPADSEISRIHRVNGSGEQVLAHTGEHIVVRPAEPDEYFRSRSQKGHSVKKVSMGPNGGSSLTLAEGLTRHCAEVLARALNAEAGIVPEPDSPRGLLVLREGELRQNISEREQERTRVLASISRDIDALEHELESVREEIEQHDEKEIAR